MMEFDGVHFKSTKGRVDVLFFEKGKIVHTVTFQLRPIAYSNLGTIEQWGKDDSPLPEGWTWDSSRLAGVRTHYLKVWNQQRWCVFSNLGEVRTLSGWGYVVTHKEE